MISKAGSSFSGSCTRRRAGESVAQYDISDIEDAERSREKAFPELIGIVPRRAPSSNDPVTVVIKLDSRFRDVLIREGIISEGSTEDIVRGQFYDAEAGEDQIPFYEFVFAETESETLPLKPRVVVHDQQIDEVFHVWQMLKRGLPGRDPPVQPAIVNGRAYPIRRIGIPMDRLHHKLALLGQGHDQSGIRRIDDHAQPVTVFGATTNQICRALRILRSKRNTARQQSQPRRHVFLHAFYQCKVS